MPLKVIVNNTTTGTINTSISGATTATLQDTLVSSVEKDVTAKTIDTSIDGESQIQLLSDVQSIVSSRIDMDNTRVLDKYATKTWVIDNFLTENQASDIYIEQVNLITNSEIEDLMSDDN